MMLRLVWQYLKNSYQKQQVPFNEAIRDKREFRKMKKQNTLQSVEADFLGSELFFDKINIVQI